MKTTIHGIHTSDNHLGFRQYGLSLREQDIIDSLKYIVTKTTIETSADYITISGDLLNSKYPSVDIMVELSNLHNFLQDLGIPCFVIAGNHDGGNKNKNWIEVIGNKADTTQHTFIEEGGFWDIDYASVSFKGVSIFGAPYMKRSAWEELQREIQPHNLLLMHQTFTEFFPFQTSNIFSIEDIDTSKFDMLVVGDIHTSKGFIHESGMLVFSPGSTELLSKGEAGEKFVVKSAFADDKFTADFEKIKSRKVYNYAVKTFEEFEAVVQELENVTTMPLLFLKIEIPFIKHTNQLSGISKLMESTILRLSYGKEIFQDEEESFLNEQLETIPLTEIGSRMMVGQLHDSDFDLYREELVHLTLLGLTPDSNFREELNKSVERLLNVDKKVLQTSIK